MQVLCKKKLVKSILKIIIQNRLQATQVTIIVTAP